MGAFFDFSYSFLVISTGTRESASPLIKSTGVYTWEISEVESHFNVSISFFNPQGRLYKKGKTLSAISSIDVKVLSIITPFK